MILVPSTTVATWFQRLRVHPWRGRGQVDAFRDGRGLLTNGCGPSCPCWWLRKPGPMKMPIRATPRYSGNLDI